MPLAYQPVIRTERCVNAQGVCAPLASGEIQVRPDSRFVRVVGEHKEIGTLHVPFHGTPAGRVAEDLEDLVGAYAVLEAFVVGQRNPVSAMHKAADAQAGQEDNRSARNDRSSPMSLHHGPLPFATSAIISRRVAGWLAQ